MRSLRDRIDDFALNLDPFGFTPDEIEQARNSGTLEGRVIWLKSLHPDELIEEDQQTLKELLKEAQWA